MSGILIPHKVEVLKQAVYASFGLIVADSSSDTSVHIKYNTHFEQLLMESKL